MAELLENMKHGLVFLMAKSKTLLDDPKIGSKIVKENTTSFSKLFGDTIAKGMKNTQEEDRRAASEDFNPRLYEGFLPKEFLNLPTTVRAIFSQPHFGYVLNHLISQVRALERMLVATLSVVENDAPAIFETMQPKAKVLMTVRNSITFFCSCCRRIDHVMCYTINPLCRSRA